MQSRLRRRRLRLSASLPAKQNRLRRKRLWLSASQRVAVKFPARALRCCTRADKTAAHILLARATARRAYGCWKISSGTVGSCLSICQRVWWTSYILQCRPARRHRKSTPSPPAMCYPAKQHDAPAKKFETQSCSTATNRISTVACTWTLCGGVACIYWMCSMKPKQWPVV